MTYFERLMKEIAEVLGEEPITEEDQIRLIAKGYDRKHKENKTEEDEAIGQHMIDAGINNIVYNRKRSK